MKDLILLQTSSLEKVMPRSGAAFPALRGASMLRGEEFSYQIAYEAAERPGYMADVSVVSELAPYIRLYRVENMPSELPGYPDTWDEDYISTQPGLFPDLLRPLEGNKIFIRPNCMHALWVTVTPGAEVPAGIYPIRILLENNGRGIIAETELRLEIIGVDADKASPVICQWFHADCLADYYQLPVFSEAHWTRMEQFIKMAGEHGITMLLAPVFTPPLDTEPGAERPTVQLVEIFKKGGVYSFCFQRLRRWLSICRKYGVIYLEIPHLFTQWGAEAAPKIVAVEDGMEKRVFGWDVEAGSAAYREFLQQFIPALRAFLREEGMEDKTYFHISDEPKTEHLQSYRKARRAVEDLLEGCNVIDALSDFAFYRQGVVQCPVVATNHLEPFLESGAEGLWCYYCCSQGNAVANRFFAMPSYRNRILAEQMYLYRIAGFLHWGYNFYYSQLSRFPVNPFSVTDCLGAYPSGDAFLVYPGEEGPLPSLRLKVFHEAVQDIAAFELLERLSSRGFVCRLILEHVDGRLDFAHYPKSADYILSLREKVNQEIKSRINGETA